MSRVRYQPNRPHPQPCPAGPPAASPDGGAEFERLLAQSMAYCRKLTRRQAHNFYYGLKLTPEPKRSALYAVYAFMRACDDLADDSVAARPGTRERIDDFRAQMVQAIAPVPSALLPAGSIWPALYHVVGHYHLNPAHLHAMLDGQCGDLAVQRYRDFDELYAYCYKVAGVVGLVCIDLWGCADEPAVMKMAEQRGVALQLTNILRDLVEDAQRDRVYLPADELERFGLDTDTFLAQMLAREVDERFDRLMDFQLQRARQYYQRSADLDRHISPDCRSTSWSIMRIYRGLLERIASRPRQVLTRRVRLSKIEKSLIALSTLWRRL